MQPLIGAVPANTLLFYISDLSKSALVERWPDMSASRQSLLGGAISGFFGLSIFVPLELLKCRAQVHKEGNVKYNNIVRELYQM